MLLFRTSGELKSGEMSLVQTTDLGQEGKNLMTNFCCGRGDCEPANLGTMSFIVAGKRDVEALDAVKAIALSNYSHMLTTLAQRELCVQETAALFRLPRI